MTFSDKKKAHFVRIFIEEGSSYVRFRRRMQKETGERFPKIPAKSTLYEWVHKFDKTGSVHKKGYRRAMLVCIFWVLMNFLGLSALRRTSTRWKQLSVRRKCLSVVLQLSWNEKRLRTQNFQERPGISPLISFKYYRSWRRMIPKSEWYSLKSSLNIWNTIKISSKTCFSRMKPIFTFTEVL